MEYVSTVRKYAHSHRPMCFFFSYFPSFFFFRSVHTSIFNEFLFIQIYTVEYIEDFWVKFYLLKFEIRCDKPHSFSPTHGCEIDASKNWVNQVKRVWKEKLFSSLTSLIYSIRSNYMNWLLNSQDEPFNTANQFSFSSVAVRCIPSISLKLILCALFTHGIILKTNI